MKKTTIMGISARLAKGIALLCSTAFTVQAMAFGTIADDNDLTALDETILQMRQQLDQTNHVTGELLGFMSETKVIDPNSLDGFDFMAMGSKLVEAGMIGDIDGWNNAGKMIEASGFVAYVEQIKVDISTLDQQLTTIGVKIAAWAALSENDRLTATKDNTDENIVPALAQLHTAVMKFSCFTMAGVTIFGDLSYRDRGVRPLIDLDAPAISDREPVVA